MTNREQSDAKGMNLTGRCICLSNIDVHLVYVN